MTKAFVTLAALLATQVTFAETTPVDACKLMPCGVYQGRGGNYSIDNSEIAGDAYTETMTIMPVAGALNKVHLSLRMKWDDSQKLNDYILDTDVEFDQDGIYKIYGRRNSTDLFAVGVCKDSVCTFNFNPFKGGDNGPIVGNVNILRFSEGRASRQMMVTFDHENPTFQRTQMKVIANPNP